jgi:NADH-quinone oxidoreductase subunit M
VNDFPWLTVIAAAPIVGAVLVMALPRGRGDLPKQVAFGVSLVTLALAIAMASGYDTGGGFQFTEQHTWIEAFGAYYAVGVDGIGLSLILMTAVLTPIVILASWHDGDAGRWSVNAFFAWMLGLEGLAVGVFAATDVFLFYVLFEATLIPIYFLIGGYGGPQRSYAAVKFLLYSLLGGLLMLASVIGLYAVSADSQFGSTYLLSELSQVPMDETTARWLFLGFMAAFAIKAPMWPVHTWLPDAASEATPGTSVLLVSVLDKIGTFGMIRFCLQLFPEASDWANPVIITLAIISIIYGALLAIGQDDIRRLIAYVSISHFGFMVMGIFAFTDQSTAGATLYMVNHGLATAALFLVTGIMIERRGSKRISDFGGAQKVAPLLSGFFLLFGLANLSLPGLAPFVSEFLVMVGTFTISKTAAVFAASAMVLGAVYILLMYQRTMTGPLRDDNAKITDLNRREVAALAPLVALLIGIGFAPQPLLDVINPAVDDALSFVDAPQPEPDVPVVEQQTVEGSKK